jgi:hypothetical protein
MAPKLTPEEIAAAEAEAASKKKKEESVGQRLLDIDRERKKLQEKLNTYAKDNLAHFEAAITAEEKLTLIATEKYRLEKSALDQIKTAHEDMAKLGITVEATQKKYLEDLENTVQKLRNAAKGGEALRDAMNDVASSSAHVLEKFTGINSTSIQLAKSVKKIGNYGKYFKKQMALVATKITQANANATVMLKLYEKTGAAAKQLKEWTVGPVLEAVDLTTGMERAIKRQDQFRLASRDVANTTAQEMSDYKEKMMRLGQAAGATTEDFMRINKEMYQTSNIFRELKNNADPARESLEKAAFTLQRRLNIPIGDVAAQTDTLSRTFGMATEESIGFSNSLVMLGKDMGLNTQKILPDFRSQANNLAKFGLPDLKDQFLKLNKIQQLTGISMDSVVSSMEKFSTFEGALNAASKLNAVFGSTIDGLELMDTVMEKGPIEGFIQLREQMEANGIEMDNLNYAQMRSLSESIGMTAEQVKAFGNISVEELRNVSAGTMDATEAYKRLQEGREEGETTEEKMLAVMDKIATSLDGLAVHLDNANRGFLDMGDSMGVWAGVLKMGIGLLGVWAGSSIAAAVLKNSVLGRSFVALAGNASTAAAATASASAAGGATTAAAGGAAKAAGIGALGSAGIIAGTTLAAGYLGYQYADEISNFLGFGDEGGFWTSGGGHSTTGFNATDNFISKPTPATVGEGGRAEIITDRTQKVLNPGDNVSRLESGPTELKLTVNLMTKDGNIVEKKEINQSLGSGGNAVEQSVAAYLHENLNLIFG